MGLKKEDLRVGFGRRCGSCKSAVQSFRVTFLWTGEVGQMGMQGIII